MRPRALLPVVLLLAACSVRRRASDPVPMAAAPTATAPVLVDQSTAAIVVPADAPPPTDKAVAEPYGEEVSLPLAVKKGPKPRVWGRVAITTAIVSPSQLIGPEVPYSPEFKAHPVFHEKLVFGMAWGLLSVGEATLGVDKIVMFNGRPAYHIVSEAR